MHAELMMVYLLGTEGEQQHSASSFDDSSNKDPNS